MDFMDWCNLLSTLYSVLTFRFYFSEIPQWNLQFQSTSLHKIIYHQPERTLFAMHFSISRQVHYEMKNIPSCHTFNQPCIINRYILFLALFLAFLLYQFHILWPPSFMARTAPTPLIWRDLSRVPIGITSRPASPASPSLWISIPISFSTFTSLPWFSIPCPMSLSLLRFHFLESLFLSFCFSRPLESQSLSLASFTVGFLWNHIRFGFFSRRRNGFLLQLVSKDPVTAE